MKYCVKCGTELFDEAVVCVKCGCATKDVINFSGAMRKSGLVTAARVFMILNTTVCVLYAFLLIDFLMMLEIFNILGFIPLVWCLPLTIIYFHKTKYGEPISTGFKVCSLLFVSLIAGILMLCDNNN